jgi:exodeoxyribonuclease VII large subunit
MPLFLPLYAERRVADLQLLADDEDQGLMGRGIHAGEHMDGQSIFSSGWEWGYWLNDVAAARAAWNPFHDQTTPQAALREILRPLSRVLGAAGPIVVDDVAHTACKTPTACAAAVGERARAFVDRFDTLADAVPTAARDLLDAAALRIAQDGDRAARAATSKLDQAALRLDHAAQRTGPAAARVLDRAQAAVDVAAAKVGAHDPALALARGWSMTRRADGTVVRSVADVSSGDELVTVVGDGRITSTVGTIDPD